MNHSTHPVLDQYIEQNDLMCLIDQEYQFLEKTQNWDRLLFKNEENSFYALLADNCQINIKDHFKQLKKLNDQLFIRLYLVNNEMNPSAYLFHFKKVKEGIFCHGIKQQLTETASSPLEFISQYSQSGVWAHYPNTNESIWSKECYNLYGVKDKTEINIEFVLSLYPKQDRMNLLNLIKALYRFRKGYKHTGLIKNPKGEQKWIRIIARPILKNDKIVKIEGVSMDVSNEINTLKRLQEERDRVHLALKGIQSGFFYHDIKKDKVVYGTNFKKIIGMPTDKTLTEPEFRKFIPEDVREEAFHRHEIQIHKKGNLYFNHYPLIIDGERQEFEVHGWKKKNMKGETTLLAGNLINIQARIDAEKEKNKQYRQLESIINNGLIYTIVFNESGEILSADKTTIEILKNYFNQDVLKVKMHFNKIFEDRVSVRFNKLKSCINEEGKYREETSIKTKIGSTIYVDLIAKRAELEAKEEVYNVFMLDITERIIQKKNRISTELSLSESNKFIDNFITNISHELSTPLNGIIGGVKALDELALSPQNQELFDLIKKSSDRILNTFKNYVSLSKKIKNVEKKDYKSVAVNTVVSKVYYENYHLASLKGLKFTMDLSQAELHIFGVVEYLKSICSQLVINAIKFTHSGHVAISVNTNNNEVQIIVEDTGIGINESEQEKIFEEFYQVSKGISRVYEGSGIGLAVVKKYINLMDGKLKIASKEGEGSTFTITFKKT